ncbi:MAG: hypothetical protein JW908_12105 [Anaerolineales bacterium]|nr:hypothetical protein [Anaerolineales bacterium]
MNRKLLSTILASVFSLIVLFLGNHILTQQSAWAAEFPGRVLSDSTSLSISQSTTPGWITETVTENVDELGASALVIDSTDQPHLSFFHSSDDLVYAVRNSSGWHFQPVGVDYAWDPSLALDAADNERPYIAYNGFRFGQNSYSLGIVWLDGTTWENTVIVNSANSGQHPSLVVDDKKVFISFILADPSLIYYLSYINSSWPPVWPATPTQIENLGPSLYSGEGHSSLVLDSYGSPCMSYAANNHLNYAFLHNSSWVTRTVDSSANVGAFNSLEFNPLDISYISYFNDTADDLKLAHWQLGLPGYWATETVDGDGIRVGGHTSLAIDSYGGLHISYCDLDYGYLKYATHPVSAPWQIEIVDDSGDCSGTSLALDSMGVPHIAYYDYENDRIIYAYRYQYGVYLPLTLRSY